MVSLNAPRGVFLQSKVVCIKLLSLLSVVLASFSYMSRRIGECIIELSSQSYDQKCYYFFVFGSSCRKILSLYLEFVLPATRSAHNINDISPTIHCCCTSYLQQEIFQITHYLTN